MSEISTTAANGLGRLHFAPLPDNEPEAAECSETAAVDLDALADDIERPPAVPAHATPILSPTAYLFWLLLQTRDALLLAKHCRTTGQSARAEPPEDPVVAPVPAEISEFERRLFDVGARIGRQIVDLAREEAAVAAKRADAFNPGLKMGGQEG